VIYLFNTVVTVYSLLLRLHFYSVFFEISLYHFYHVVCGLMVGRVRRSSWGFSVFSPSSASFLTGRAERRDPSPISIFLFTLLMSQADDRFRHLFAKWTIIMADFRHLLPTKRTPTVHTQLTTTHTIIMLIIIRGAHRKCICSLSNRIGIIRHTLIITFLHHLNMLNR